MKSRLCRGPQVRRIPELYGSVQFELSVCADGHIDGQAYKPVVPDVCLGQTPSKTEYFPARVSPYAACVPHAQSALRASSVPSFECAVLLSQSDRKLRSRKEAAEKVLRHVSEKLHQVQHYHCPTTHANQSKPVARTTAHVPALSDEADHAGASAAIETRSTPSDLPLWHRGRSGPCTCCSA